MKTVVSLISTVSLATRIAKAAKVCNLEVRNSDKSEHLFNFMSRNKPVLVILDWDGCEAEAFKFLKELSQNADLKDIATVGCLLGSKLDLKEEAQRAGCHRVYTRTDFNQDLETIMARYVK